MPSRLCSTATELVKAPEGYGLSYDPGQRLLHGMTLHLTLLAPFTELDLDVLAKGDVREGELASGMVLAMAFVLIFGRPL